MQKLSRELDEKEVIIGKINVEKREYMTRFDQLEIQNNEILDTLTAVEKEKEELEQASKNLQLIVAA